MNNIVLIGMPGSGKSTIGVILAKRLGYDFVDTDNLISDREKTTLQDIIDKKGVSEFLKIDNTVIATGGSMVFSDSAMKNLLDGSKCVFIDVPLPEIKRRVKNIDTRGIAMGKDDTLDTLYEKRMPKYREYADITVEVKQNSKIDNVVSKILDKLK